VLPLVMRCELQNLVLPAKSLSNSAAGPNIRAPQRLERVYYALQITRHVPAITRMHVTLLCVPFRKLPILHRTDPLIVHPQPRRHLMIPIVTSSGSRKARVTLLAGIAICKVVIQEGGSQAASRREHECRGLAITMCTDRSRGHRSRGQDLIRQGTGRHVRGQYHPQVTLGRVHVIQATIQLRDLGNCGVHASRVQRASTARTCAARA
jgi:hypothetical protein